MKVEVEELEVSLKGLVGRQKEIEEHASQNMQRSEQLKVSSVHSSFAFGKRKVDIL